jgi:hypothetical protein
MVTFNKPITSILDNKTAAASASTSLADCTAIDTNGVLSLGIGYRVTYHGSATAAGVLKLFASYDGTNYDDQVYDQWTLPFLAGASYEGHYSVHPGPRYLKALVTNLDTVQSITGIYIYSEPQTISA